MKRNNVILLAVGSLLTAFLIYYSIRYKHYSINSVSMMNTLKIDDVILIDTYFKKVKKNSIYVLEHNESEVIYRVVGMPGDTLIIKEAQLLVNSKKRQEKGTFRYNYVVTANQKEFSEKQLENYKIISYDGFSKYVLSISNKEIEEFSKQQFIRSFQRIVYPVGYQYKRSNVTVFPEAYQWSRDNYGPIIIPSKEMILKLNKDNLPLYKMIIENEQNKVRVENNTIFINDKKETSYTFKNNYYWVMGDNRHQAKDSRFIGFIPENHFVGVLKTIIYSPQRKKQKFFIDAE